MKVFLRIIAVVAVAAGVGVVVMATREEGREKLSQLGEFLSGSFDRLQGYGDVPSYPYQSQKPYQNHSQMQQQGEYTAVR
jgi:hypothetical protein